MPAWAGNVSRQEACRSIRLESERTHPPCSVCFWASCVNKLFAAACAGTETAISVARNAFRREFLSTFAEKSMHARSPSFKHESQLDSSSVHPY